MAVPPGVVTVTVTGPEPAGAVMLIVVAVLASMVAGLPMPNVTEVAPARFEPLILTSVPAVVGPVAGEMLLVVGAATYVYVRPVSVPPTVVTVIVTGPAA